MAAHHEVRQQSCNISRLPLLGGLQPPLNFSASAEQGSDAICAVHASTCPFLHITGRGTN